MRFFYFVATLIWLHPMPARAKDAPLDPKRPHLVELVEDDYIKFYEYVSPFLVVQYATTTTKPQATVENQFRRYLKEKKLAFRGHFDEQPGLALKDVNTKNLPMPSEVMRGDQLEGIEDCNAEYCKMKLNIKHEKTRMEKSKNKVQTYHQLVIKRFKRYLEKGTLCGYEEEWDGNKRLDHLLQTLTFLKKTYPDCLPFFRHPHKKTQAKRCRPLNSFFRSEIVQMRLDKLQPIWRMSQVIEVKQGTRTLFFEPHIYTNHYFDSSARLFEFHPLRKKEGKNRDQTAIIITDIQEIDTLKASSVARFLYKREMAKTVFAMQKADIQAALKEK